MVNIFNVFQRIKKSQWYKQDDFVKDMRSHHATMKERGANPLLLKDISIGVKGGHCPICGKEYKKTHKYKDQEMTAGFSDEPTGHLRYDYYCYKEQCECITNQLFPEKFTATEMKFLTAGIPGKYWGCSFENWDYDVVEKINESMRSVYYYSTKDESGLGNWIGLRGRGIFLYGENGRGKSHLAISLVRVLMEQTNYKIQYIQCATIQDESIYNTQKISYRNRVLQNDVLVFDDFEKANYKNDWARNEMFAFIESTTADMKIAIIMANLNEYEDLLSIFGKSIQSRLKEFKFIRFVEGDDYREKKALRESREDDNG